MGKKLIGIVFAGVLTVGAMAADVVIRVAPPRVVAERRGRPPSRDHVWIGGYQRWDGRAYAWVPGRWEAPPRRHARWVEHRWARRDGGWVFVEGRWR